MSQQSIAQWLQSLPVPWLVSGPVGSQDVGSYGTVLDGQVSLIRQAVLARMPLLAPPDALPHIGGDRQLVQGPTETNDNFAIRLHTAWDDWARAGTALELLVQLYWAGFPYATIVTQNGLMYSLSGSPTAGDDPTDLLVVGYLSGNHSYPGFPASPITVIITTSGFLGTMEYTTTVNGVTSGPFTTVAGAYYGAAVENTLTRITFADYPYDQGLPANQWVINTNGTITPSGGATATLTQDSSAPWWTFDSNDSFCSRFAVLFYGPDYPPLMTTWGTATFTASASANVTWNNVFPDMTYKIQPGAAIVTDGGGAVDIVADETTKTTTGVTILSSGTFTGTVDVLAYQAGSNPYVDFHPADLARLRLIINTWRPGKARCVGVICLAEGRMWGIPVTTWGASGLTWGPATVVTYDV